ncbi:MAG: single-stranded DNA-binding protein [Bacilli bacterium]|nr:single-stranded DNA-binding protein [Bacilli bacterium]
MHNMVYLIGRLTEDPCIKKLEDDRDMLTINLAVQRSFKNEDNIYETDYLRCILWNALAEHTCEYCRKGDLVGIKGRIQTRSYEDEDKNIKYITEIIVDRISFLASAKSHSDETKIIPEDEEVEEDVEKED